MLYHLFGYLGTYFEFPGEHLLEFISSRSAFAAILSLLMSLWFGKKMIHYFKKRNISETVRDLNLGEETQKSKTPTMGGIFFILSSLISVMFFCDLTNIYILLLIFTMISTGAIGFIDDYIKTYKKNKAGVSSKFKIIGQSFIGLVIGITLYFYSDVRVVEEIYPDNKVTKIVMQNSSLKTTLPFFKNNEMDYHNILGFLSTQVSENWSWVVYTLIVIFVIVAVSNGSNLTDGMDGLAASTSIVVLTSLGLLAWISGNILFAKYLNILFIPSVGEVLIFVSAIVGALIGFLWYNTYPAQIFMGDTGSLTIGSIVALLAFIVRKELLLPLLCGVFLLENLSVIIQVFYFKYTKKISGVGKRIFLIAPIHHHFHKKGIHESKIVSRFVIIQILLSVLTLITLKLQ